MILKPARPGLKVRDPRTGQHLPEGGARVSTLTTYWRRRIAEGSVLLVEEGAPAAPIPAPAEED